MHSELYHLLEEDLRVPLQAPLLLSVTGASGEVVTETVSIRGWEKPIGSE